MALRPHLPTWKLYVVNVLTVWSLSYGKRGGTERITNRTNSKAQMAVNAFNWTFEICTNMRKHDRPALTVRVKVHRFMCIQMLPIKISFWPNVRWDCAKSPVAISRRSCYCVLGPELPLFSSTAWLAARSWCLLRNNLALKFGSLTRACWTTRSS